MTAVPEPILAPTFRLQVLGCKVSQYDAGRLEEALFQLGFQAAPETVAPDLFVLQSCAVTGRASQKTRQMLHAAHRRRPDGKTLLVGCEARLRDLRHDETTDADAVLLPDWSREDLIRTLTHLGFCSPLPRISAADAVPASGATLPVPGLALPDEDEKPMDLVEGRSRSSALRTRAFLKIQDGCNQFCTYCIVPHLRGPEVSRPAAEILTEAGRQVQEGFQEIVLTGIHLGRYAFGLENLLAGLDTLPGLHRIRVSSIDPHEIGDGLLDWLERSPKACCHLHLPLQSGSDEILRRMNRPYDTRLFSDLLAKLRRRFPGIAISTDLLVGFPGERDSHFSETIRFVEQMQFSSMHIFRYSPRPGTPAADFPEQVPASTKKARADQVEKLAQAMALRFHEDLLGHPLEVLWETGEGNTWSGLSREYIPCRTVSGRPLANTISSFVGEAADVAGLHGVVA